MGGRRDALPTQPPTYCADLEQHHTNTRARHDTGIPGHVVGGHRAHGSPPANGNAPQRTPRAIPCVHATPHARNQATAHRLVSKAPAKPNRLFVCLSDVECARARAFAFRCPLLVALPSLMEGGMASQPCIYPGISPSGCPSCQFSPSSRKTPQCTPVLPVLVP